MLSTCWSRDTLPSSLLRVDQDTACRFKDLYLCQDKKNNTLTEDKKKNVEKEKNTWYTETHPNMVKNRNPPITYISTSQLTPVTALLVRSPASHTQY